MTQGAYAAQADNGAKRDGKAEAQAGGSAAAASATQPGSGELDTKHIPLLPRNPHVVIPSRGVVGEKKEGDGCQQYKLLIGVLDQLVYVAADHFQDGFPRIKSGRLDEVGNRKAVLFELRAVDEKGTVIGDFDFQRRNDTAFVIYNPGTRRYWRLINGEEKRDVLVGDLDVVQAQHFMCDSVIGLGDSQYNGSLRVVDLNRQTTGRILYVHRKADQGRHCLKASINSNAANANLAEEEHAIAFQFIPTRPSPAPALVQLEQQSAVIEGLQIQLQVSQDQEKALSKRLEELQKQPLFDSPIYSHPPQPPRPLPAPPASKNENERYCTCTIGACGVSCTVECYTSCFTSIYNFFCSPKEAKVAPLDNKSPSQHQSVPAATAAAPAAVAAFAVVAPQNKF